MIDIRRSTFEHWLLLAQHRIDDGLLAFQAADASAFAALGDPLAGVVVAVNRVKLPHRTLIRITSICAFDARRIGGHARDFVFNAGAIFANCDGLVITFAHFCAVQAGQTTGLGEQSVGFWQHNFAGSLEIAF